MEGIVGAVTVVITPARQDSRPVRRLPERSNERAGGARGQRTAAARAVGKGHVHEHPRLEERDSARRDEPQPRAWSKRPRCTTRSPRRPGCSASSTSWGCRRERPPAARDRVGSAPRGHRLATSSLEGAAGSVASGNLAAIGTLLGDLESDKVLPGQISSELQHVVSVDLGLSVAETRACRQLVGIPI